MSQRNLVPLDGSPLAGLALNKALTFAQLPEPQVHLHPVIPPIQDVDSPAETFTIDQQWEHGAGRAREYRRGIC